MAGQVVLTIEDLQLAMVQHNAAKQTFERTGSFLFMGSCEMILDSMDQLSDEDYPPIEVPPRRLRQQAS